MKKRLLYISIVLFLTISSMFGQVAGPCGSTITITTASNPGATDGTITIKGLTNKTYFFRMGIVGSEMVSQIDTTSATTKVVLTGLAAGTYRVFTGRQSLAGVWECGWDSLLVTVGAASYVTCAGTEIGGLVFHDANANGAREAGESGAGNVTINAYNAAGTLAATQTTAASGVFKMTGLASGQPYRLEYVWADSYLQSGAAGSASGTSIQFVNSGTCTANLGINNPANYCQSINPYVMTPCYVNGNPFSSGVAPLDVMVAFPYKAANHNWDIVGQNVAPTHVATASQIGATWAVAYQKTTKYAYTGAVMRRFAGFGTLGTGGIYKINMTTPTAPSVSNWIDVKSLGINTGNDTRNGTTANTLSTSPGTPTWDAEAFNQVGKVGIGGMDFNGRGDTLWLINLADKKLYGIKNVSPSVIPVSTDVIGGYSVTLPSGYSYLTNSGDFRPWAVKYHNGLVYVGAVCSGESTPWDTSKIRGYVLSFDPKNVAAGFSYVTDFKLNYTRWAYGQGTTFNYYPWVSNATYQAYTAQPIVMDLEFDIDGSLIVAIGDRGGLQTGNNNYAADPTATNRTLIEGNSFGDLLRFCKTGSTYTQSGVAACPNPTVNPFTLSEYYWGDVGPLTSFNKAFNENGAGSIAFSAGNNAILGTAQDAYAWFSGGVIAFNNTSGGDMWRYVIFDSSTPGGSGKATGLGDIEPLCDPAPIEIGNRVWLDTDRDGIQDAGEAGIAGITIQLYKGLTLVATTTTDANGKYIFTGLLPNTAYSISMALGQAALGSKPLSTVNAGTNDLIDSDMSKVGTTGIIVLTTGNFGENNHSYDIGFEPNCNATVTVAGSDNCVGGTATLAANGSSTGFYVWSGPNSFASLSQNPSISNVQLVNSGSYSVTFTKSNGCTATGSAQVNVNPVVSITAQPIAFSECIGGAQSLSVTATGGFAPLTYQWYSSTDNGLTWNILSTATASTYIPLSTLAGTTLYKVTVSSNGGNGCSAATSNNISITIANDPIVTVSTLPTTVCVGANLTLTANPTGGAGACTVQWQSSPATPTNWTDISGATGNTYNVTSASNTIRYRAIMTCTGSGCCN